MIGEGKVDFALSTTDLLPDETCAHLREHDGRRICIVSRPI
jgi:hypothetical protein